MEVALSSRNKGSRATLEAGREGSGDTPKGEGSALLCLREKASPGGGDACARSTKVDRRSELLVRICDSLFSLLAAVSGYLPWQRYLMTAIFRIIIVIKH